MTICDPHGPISNEQSSPEKLYRLCVGYHFFPTPKGEYLLYIPTGRFIRLKVAADLLKLLEPVINGQVNLATVSTALSTTDQTKVQAVIAGFIEQGYLQVQGEAFTTVQTSLPPTRLAVLGGNNPLSREVLRLLEEYASIELVDLAQKPTVLVSCESWIPDKKWLTLDAYCRDYGVVWQRCYAEGASFYIGPLFVPEQTAGYKDERDRRLAAAFPEELKAYWQYLDTHPDQPFEWQPGVATTLAGLMVTQLMDWLKSGQSAGHIYQTQWQPGQNLWERHPLLPVPRGILR